MFVHVTRDLKIALEEKQDFKHFKLVIDASRADAAGLGAALSGVATLTDDDHAWVSEDWLRRQDSAAPWQDGLTAMIAVAAKYGWIDAQEKTIRAHVEWPDDAQAKR